MSRLASPHLFSSAKMCSSATSGTTVSTVTPGGRGNSWRGTPGPGSPPLDSSAPPSPVGAAISNPGQQQDRTKTKCVVTGVSKQQLPRTYTHKHTSVGRRLWVVGAAPVTTVRINYTCCTGKCVEVVVGVSVALRTLLSDLNLHLLPRHLLLLSFRCSSGGSCDNGSLQAPALSSLHRPRRSSVRVEQLTGRGQGRHRHTCAHATFEKGGDAKHR
jgi:hypothetical protein